MPSEHPSERMANSSYASNVFSITAVEQLHLLPPGTQMYRIAEWFQANLLSGAELNDLLSRWWPKGGYANEIGYERAAEVFRFAGFVRETNQSTRPTTEVRVFRGTTYGAETGLSWSLEYEVAAWFANRYTDRGEPGILCSALVAPHQILGSFDSDNLREAELVIDPETLVVQEMNIADASSPAVQIAALKRMIKTVSFVLPQSHSGPAWIHAKSDGIVSLNHAFPSVEGK